MPLHVRTAHEVLGLLTRFVGPQRPTLEADPRLAGWLPDLDQATKDLQAALAFTPPAPVVEEVSIEALDRRAESSIRAVRQLILAHAELAVAQGRDADAEAWREVLEKLLPQGLGFFTGRILGQVGATEALLPRAQDPSLQAVGAKLNLEGLDLAGLMAVVAERNQALSHAFKKVAPVDPSAPPAGVSGEAYRAAIKLAAQVESIAERVLPPATYRAMMGIP
jgi:hypothetical protein